jgi:O-antigen/teichoic acid export membrane protein
VVRRRREHPRKRALKLLAVVVPIAFGGDVVAVAQGYLVATLLGLGISAALLFQLLRDRGLWRELDLRKLRFPAREMLAFGIPLMSTDLVNTAILSGATLVLGAYHDASEVAQFRAALPIARLNLLVMTTFQLLYMPQAARLAARGDPAAVSSLYWRTAAWISILSFPVFALTGSFAREAMLVCYGERYAEAWPQLFALSVACYFNVVTGFNGLTLLALGRLCFVLATNALSIGIALVLAFALIPTWGATGAAVATALALIAFNAIKHVGLRLSAGINIFDRKYSSLYAGIAVGAGGLLALQLATDERWLALPATIAVSLALLHTWRDTLQIAEIFPELARVPALRWLTTGAPRDAGPASARRS